MHARECLGVRAALVVQQASRAPKAGREPHHGGARDDAHAHGRGSAGLHGLAASQGGEGVRGGAQCSETLAIEHGVGRPPPPALAQRARRWAPPMPDCRRIGGKHEQGLTAGRTPARLAFLASEKAMASFLWIGIG